MEKYKRTELNKFESVYTSEGFSVLLTDTQEEKERKNMYKLHKWSMKDDNQWGADKELIIGITEYGNYFCMEIIPSGYGEYTYDPIEAERLACKCTFSQFKNFALDDYWRDVIGEWKPNILAELLNEIGLERKEPTNEARRLYKRSPSV